MPLSAGHTWWITSAGIAFASGGTWYLQDESWKPSRPRIIEVSGNPRVYLHKETFISWAWGDDAAVVKPPYGARCWIQTDDPSGEFDARTWVFPFNPRDINCDGKVNSADALNLMAWVIAGEPRGDWNNDGVVNDMDVTAYSDAGR